MKNNQPSNLNNLKKFAFLLIIYQHVPQRAFNVIFDGSSRYFSQVGSRQEVPAVLLYAKYQH
jgi:hypothetical protein